MVTYVVTLQCKDLPGIVLATSTAIVEVGGNILENDQFTDPVTGQFCMRTRFETENGNIDAVRDLLTGELAAFEPRLGIRNEETERRAIIMVSTFDHCLADLLYRREQGDLPLDIVAVVRTTRTVAPSPRATRFPSSRFRLRAGRRRRRKTSFASSLIGTASTSSCWLATCRCCPPSSAPT